ncbi:hypothetical protein G5V57_27640 [Nordella sp. HKS 07]|uniref:hypothetical protein n=1 Tax=Nordella sp. HKS 07 TaxID=2712222 RepID=UPI0013E1DEC1|nr:hypothetical protein [Nordella sp. HKS 07]QIG51165.1 hypothetical protein G5V57_27640 [Nordella sp. HKS 07]
MGGAFRFAVRFLASVFLLAGLYLIAALSFALLPVSGRAQQVQGEPVVYVCASLAHAEIVMPGRDPLMDWAALFPAVTPPGAAGLSQALFAPFNFSVTWPLEASQTDVTGTCG